MVDMFQNSFSNSLIWGVELSPDEIITFRKDTNTDLYVHFTSTFLLNK